MLADRYDLPVSTASAAARDAYVEGCDLALTLYPGAVEAFDRALAIDSGLALAHAGKAQIFMREGKAAAARAALTAAKDAAAGVSAREAGHIRFFDLAFSGETDAAIEALYAHLAQWPRDALMVAAATNPNGLIGSSGRIGQKQQTAAVARPSRAALRRRLLVPLLSCDRAGRGRPRRGGPAEDRALGHAEPEERTLRTRDGARLLRERRCGRRPRLPLLVARHVSARGRVPWTSQLASCTGRAGSRQLDGGAAALSRRHRARPAPGRAAAEDVGRRCVSVALRAGRPSARRARMAHAVRLCRRRALHGRAPGSPIFMSSSPTR